MEEHQARTLMNVEDTISVDEQQLISIIRKLSAAKRREVLRFVQFLGLDPVARALLTAPLDDEPVTEEERQAVREADEEIRRGELLTLEQVEAELGL